MSFPWEEERVIIDKQCVIFRSSAELIDKAISQTEKAKETEK